MRKLEAVASLGQRRLMLPGWVNAALSVDDVATMARPVLETATQGAECHARVQHWLDWLGALPSDRPSRAQIEAFTQGRRDGVDSLHLLVMDLHKQINRLSGEMASEGIDGANVWDVRPEDRARVAAFMRGLNRGSEPVDFHVLEGLAGRERLNMTLLA